MGARKHHGENRIDESKAHRVDDDCQKARRDGPEILDERSHIETVICPEWCQRLYHFSTRPPSITKLSTSLMMAMEVACRCRIGSSAGTPQSDDGCEAAIAARKDSTALLHCEISILPMSAAGHARHSPPSRRGWFAPKGDIPPMPPL